MNAIVEGMVKRLYHVCQTAEVIPSGLSHQRSEQESSILETVREMSYRKQWQLFLSIRQKMEQKTPTLSKNEGRDGPDSERNMRMVIVTL